MSEQYYGTPTKIDPPIVIDGKTYSFAVYFNQSPTDRDENVIVSGTVHQVVDLGSGYKKIICSRGTTTDSFFVSRLDGGPYEQTFLVSVGGNCVDGGEPTRLYNWSNYWAVRGNVRLAEGGDCFIWNGKRFLISDTEAFAAAPSTVDYTTDSSQKISYINLDFQNIQAAFPDLNINPDASLFFDNDGDRVWEDNRLYETDGTNPFDRIIFNLPSTTPDKFFYPSNATLASKKYWVDPIGGTYNIGDTSAVGNTIVGIYYWRNIQYLATDTSVKIIEGSGTGYADIDNLTLWSSIVRGDFSESITFYDLSGMGQGSVEWRSSNSANAQVFAIEFDNTQITGCYKRDVDEDTIANVSYSNPTNPFEGNPYFITIRIVKSGNTFSFYLIDNNELLFLLASTTLTGVIDDTSGLISVGNWDSANPVKFGGLPNAEWQQLFDYSGSGIVSSQRSFTETGILYTQSYGISGSTALLDVVNVGLNTSLSESATTARNHYSKSGNILTFYSVSAGDQIKIIEAAGTSPDAPGYAPYYPGTVNFATRVSESDKTATTTLSENISNYRDAITVYDPYDRLSATNGDVFSVTDVCIFDSRNAPIIYVDEYNNASTDFTVVNSGDYYSDWVSGVVLFSSDFVSTYHGKKICIKAFGRRFRSTNTKSRQWIDACKAIESIDNLYFFVSTNGTAPIVSGTITTPSYHSSGTACDGCGPYTPSMLIGITKGDYGGIVDTLIAAGASFPYWHEFYTGALYRQEIVGGGGSSEAMQYSGAYNTAPQYCCPPSTGFYDRALEGTTALMCSVFPEGDGLGSSNYAGCQLSVIDEFGTLGETSFNFRGVPLGVEELKKLPQGTEVVSAYMTVRLGGLKSYSWSVYHNLTSLFYGGPTETLHTRIIINGVTVREVEWVDGGSTIITDISNPTPPFDTNSSMGFVLMGKRIKSENIYLPIFDDFRTQESGYYKSYGAGLSVGSSDITDEVQKIVSVKSAMQALINEAREDDCGEFFLWPTRAGVTMETGISGLSAYAQSLLPTQSVSFSTSGASGPTSRVYNASGHSLAWDNLTAGHILMSVRIPGEASVFPIILPALY